ncbi:fungal-specific transcription factor domain-containing protein [Bisporella sp. PMI_857]|nr:fungal-specific transcription factor domain-containing protein [Bisporella sp. PMI_857]
MDSKRSFDDIKHHAIQNGNTPKKIKTEDPAQFSAAVKKKLQSSSRTGQACDRCKHRTIRKIRCDVLPGGCSPCLQTSTTCQTTDRTTGLTRVRGAEERLEDENRALRDRVQELTDQLNVARQEIQQGKGGQGQPNGYRDPPSEKYGYSYAGKGTQPSSWGGNVTANNLQGTSSRAPSFRPGSLQDTFLGVSSKTSNLSVINGTALSIFGMEIDIADFESADMDPPDNLSFNPRLYNKSFQAFTQTALNINVRLEPVEFPSRSDGFSYFEWYFQTLHIYCPVLHRPTTFKLLTRMYDDPNFRPNPAETVIVHMVFAIMYFHFAVRNQPDEATKNKLTSLSNAHYHYALGFFYQVSSSRTWMDVQALTIICMHLRNFPKPGASWVLSQTTMSMAIEIGLHRSVKRWVTDSPPSPLEIEMRKRVFFALLAVSVTLSGKLNRPMMLRLEDIDVEVPEPVDDELLSEQGLDRSRPGKCGHEVGLAAFRMTLLYLELYSTIYAIRSNPEEYVTTVSRLESKLRDWKSSLPAQLSKPGDSESGMEGKVFAIYTQLWALEFRMLLRHPSKTATDDPGFNDESMKICVESSQQMLEAVKEARRYKSLDTTWYQVAVYVMAITITLYDNLEKRNKISVTEFAALRKDMDSWLDVLGEVGTLIGAGSIIQAKVQSVIDSQLGLLARSLPSQDYASQDSKPVHQQPASHTFQSNHSYSSDQSARSHSYTPDALSSHQQTPYPHPTQYSPYAEAPPAQNINYTPSATYPSYPIPSQNESIESPVVGPYQGTHTHHSLSQASPTNSYHHSPANPTNLAWQQYASNFGGAIEHQDSYSASALMQLQNGRDLSTEGGHHSDLSGGANLQSAPMGGPLGAQVTDDINQWPLIVFSVGQTQ